MKPTIFVQTFLPSARNCQRATGIPAVAILVQAALESAWGESAPNNNFFGEKAGQGFTGHEQLLKTTEYSQRSDLVFPVIISKTPCDRGGKKYWKYIVKDWFKVFDSPEQAFEQHCQFFLKNPRYAEALKVTGDPVQFLNEVAKAGYATDPNYAVTCKSIAGTIVSIIKNQAL